MDENIIISIITFDACSTAKWSKVSEFGGDLGVGLSEVRHITDLCCVNFAKLGTFPPLQILKVMHRRPPFFRTRPISAITNDLIINKLFNCAIADNS
jgi:hypothetical protein